MGSCPANSVQIRATTGRYLLWLRTYRCVESSYSVNAGCPFLRIISSSVFLITFSSINLFISSTPGAVSSGPEHPATSSLRTAFNGSACWVEMTLCGFSWASRIRQPAARVRSSPESYVRDATTKDQHSYARRSIFPKRVAIECVRGIASSISSLAYIPWSPAPTSRSSHTNCNVRALLDDADQ